MLSKISEQINLNENKLMFRMAVSEYYLDSFLGGML